MVNFPARGIGNKSLEKIIEGAQQQKSGLLRFSEQGAPNQELKSAAKQSLESFARPLWVASQKVKKAKKTFSRKFISKKGLGSCKRLCRSNVENDAKKKSI